MSVFRKNDNRITFHAVQMKKKKAVQPENAAKEMNNESNTNRKTKENYIIAFCLFVDLMAKP